VHELLFETLTLEFYANFMHKLNVAFRKRENPPSNICRNLYHSNSFNGNSSLLRHNRRKWMRKIIDKSNVSYIIPGRKTFFFISLSPSLHLSWRAFQGFNEIFHFVVCGTLETLERKEL
jgi:hypothetical protein